MNNFRVKQMLNTKGLLHLGKSPCKSVLFAFILSLVGLPGFTAAQEAHPPHWAYEGKEGAENWGKLDSSYAACSTGHIQSPIDIKDAKVADLPALKFES
jgi:carbonic anhydrase